MTETVPPNICEIGKILVNKKNPLKDRFRALFTLKHLGGKEALDIITSCFDDESALLKHELAYCMGQMQDEYAVAALIRVLQDTSQEPMVRHEAGEALGAIGSWKKEVVDNLKQYSTDSVVEVAETCQLALQRIIWLKDNTEDQSNLSVNPYKSVDPAPPSSETEIESLHQILLDETQPLFQRYRAMFSLRNKSTEESVVALAEGLKCKSALFRHEIAYVLGQIRNDACVEQLAANLCDINENPMVRHECAEALGSIATDRCTKILQNYSTDKERVVKESCFVALDMSEYENSLHFQYGDSLSKIQKSS